MAIKFQINGIHQAIVPGSSKNNKWNQCKKSYTLACHIQKTKTETENQKQRKSREGTKGKKNTL